MLLQEVVAKLPDHAPAWTLLGTIHEMQGNKQQAIQAYVIGLHCNMKDGQTWKKLAYLYKDDGDLARAVDAAVRGVKLCPDDFVVRSVNHLYLLLTSCSLHNAFACCSFYWTQPRGMLRKVI
jgi:Flp pilus assembly protein TadD